MYRHRRLIISLAVVLFVVYVPFFNAAADHDEQKKQKPHHEKEDRHETEDNDKDDLSPVNNPTYLENCGSCHLAYPADLLPFRSWTKILNEIDTHFGEAVIIDPNATQIISKYLKINAADSSSSKVSIKIMKGIDGQTPTRITELPYIIKKHHEVAPSVFKRAAIGSLSNCTACHKTAEKGDFDDDGVVIPK